MDQSRSYVAARRYFLCQEALPLTIVNGAELDRWRSVNREATGVCCPLAQAHLDLCKRPLPLGRTGGRRALGKAHPFMISKRGEGLDVTVVEIPATWDDMMIEVWVAPYEIFDPLTQRDPLGAQIGKRDVGPKGWRGDVQVIGTFELAQELRVGVLD